MQMQIQVQVQVKKLTPIPTWRKKIRIQMLSWTSSAIATTTRILVPPRQRFFGGCKTGRGGARADRRRWPGGVRLRLQQMLRRLPPSLPQLRQWQRKKSP
jgi:hypothetical protein